MKKTGFTLIEITLSLGLLAIIASLSIPIYNDWLPNTSVEQAVDQFTNLYALARSQSLSGVDDSRHGVYLDLTNEDLKKIIIYEGDSYQTRLADKDQTENLPVNIDIISSLAGNDINFSAVYGRPSTTGEISFQSSSGKKKLVISINEPGLLNIVTE